MDTEGILSNIEHMVDKVEDWSILPAEPVVSVGMITYNHEAFIRQALDGVLMQVTSFPYEVVIGEDKSTDRTREIVQEYQQRHPDRIRLRLARENLYSQGIKPTVGLFRACRGKYIALCEGDDYWTDPFKLQKQVDFLEAHPDYSMCFHRAYRLVQATGEMELWRTVPRVVKPTYTLDDAILEDFAATASMLLRNGMAQELPAWYQDCAVGDWPLLVLYAQLGEIGLIDQAMSVHRVHSGGVIGGASVLRFHHMLMSTIEIVGTHLGSDYAKQIRFTVAGHLMLMASLSADRHDLPGARTYFRRSIAGCPLGTGMQSLDRLVLLGRLYAPPVYKTAKRLQTSLSLLSGTRSA